MPWQKISDLPDQRFIGPYGIEFWRIHEGQVFHQGRQLRKADAASFEFTPAHYFIGRDAHAVYHAWTRQTSIDRDSFRQCGAYWLDNHAVYFEHETSLKAMAEADCTTFRDLGGGYGADDHGDDGQDADQEQPFQARVGDIPDSRRHLPRRAKRRSGTRRATG